jgi:hypothetical protein
MGFEELVRFVRDGEPVTAGVVGRPDRALDRNVRDLRDRVLAVEAGVALVDRGRPVEPLAAVGAPVYWDGGTLRFERARYATVALTGGRVMLAASARPWGVVLRKTAATVADVLVGGVAAVDLTEAAGGNAAGVYYLTGTAGALSATPPPIAVPVVRADGQGRVLVCPPAGDPSAEALLSELTSVTSLVSTDPRLEIVCATDGTEAAAGPLKARIDLSLAVAAGADRGSTVLKTLDPETGLFHGGPVVEGVYAAGPGVTLTSDLDPVPLDPDDEESEPLYRGRVGISLSGDVAYELDALLTRLHAAATQEYSHNVMYLGLPASGASSFVDSFRVPEAAPFASPKFRYRLRLLAAASGTLPALTVTALVLPRPPAGLATAVAIPGSPSSLAMTTVAAVGTAYRYVEATSSPVDAPAGAQVFVSVSRAGSDGYAGTLGVLDHYATVGGS